MSKIKKIAFWIVGGVVLVLMGLGAYPWWPVVRDSFGSNRYVSYLEANRVPLDLSLQEAGFSFPNKVYASRLIMLGEVHGYAVPQRLDLALLQHLSSHAGVRWYLAELDPAQAMAINKYIAGGDSAAVAAVFDRWADQSAQWGNRDFFNKLSGIRAMNAALPPDRQVRFIGVDAPQSDVSQRGLDLPSEGSLYAMRRRRPSTPSSLTIRRERKAMPADTTIFSATLRRCCKWTEARTQHSTDSGASSTRSRSRFRARSRWPCA